MERLTIRRIAAAGTLLALGNGALAACSQEESPSRDSSSRETCSGLPRYKVVHRTKGGQPYIKFADKNEDCYSYLYEKESGLEIPNSYIDKTTTLLACIDNPREGLIWGSIIENGDIANTGYIALSDTAEHQLDQTKDIPAC